MTTEELTAGQILAIEISLDAPSDRTLDEFLEESATDLTITATRSAKYFEVRTDHQGGEMTGMLVKSDLEGDEWDMLWDGFEL